MLEYLEDKYGEEFVPLSYAGESWAYSYDKLSAHPKGKEDQIFNIQGCKNKEGKYVCHDNYFYYIIRDEYEQAMSNIVKIYFTDFKLYMLRGEGMYPDRLNYGTKIKDIYKEGEKFNANFNLFVKKSNTKSIGIDKMLIEIAQKRLEQKFIGELSFYNTYDEKYKLINREKWYDSKDKWFEPNISVIVKQDLEVYMFKDNKHIEITN